MAQALAMEIEAAQRYTEFADAMEMHNNREVAALFRTMAGIEGKHAAADHGRDGLDASARRCTPRSGDVAGLRGAGDRARRRGALPDAAVPRAASSRSPNEQRAERFFARARARGDDRRRCARRRASCSDEEREHVALVRAWMKKVPKPDADWANDPDPPRYTD